MFLDGKEDPDEPEEKVIETPIPTQPTPIQTPSKSESSVAVDPHTPSKLSTPPEKEKNGHRGSRRMPSDTTEGKENRSKEKSKGKEKERDKERSRDKSTPSENHEKIAAERSAAMLLEAEKFNAIASQNFQMLRLTARERFDSVATLFFLDHHFSFSCLRRELAEILDIVDELKAERNFEPSNTQSFEEVRCHSHLVMISFSSEKHPINSI